MFNNYLNHKYPSTLPAVSFGALIFGGREIGSSSQAWNRWMATRRHYAPGILGAGWEGWRWVRTSGPRVAKMNLLRLEAWQLAARGPSPPTLQSVPPGHSRTACVPFPPPAPPNPVSWCKVHKGEKKRGKEKLSLPTTPRTIFLRLIPFLPNLLEEFIRCHLFFSTHTGSLFFPLNQEFLTWVLWFPKGSMDRIWVGETLHLLVHYPLREI